MINCTFPRKEFLSLLQSLGSLNDTAILNLSPDGMDAVTTSSDNSIALWTHLEGDFPERVLNLPSLKKLGSAVKLMSGDQAEFSLASNHLLYSGNRIRFKYHLHEDGILTRPKLSLIKIKSFSYDVEFEVESSDFKNLIKNSALTNTSKLYLGVGDGHLIWELGDKTVPNSDSLVVIGDEVDFEMDEPFIMMVDNARLISTLSDKIKFCINSTMGYVKIMVQSGDLTLNYIAPSLKN